MDRGLVQGTALGNRLGSHFSLALAHLVEVPTSRTSTCCGQHASQSSARVARVSSMRFGRGVPPIVTAASLEGDREGVAHACAVSGACTCLEPTGQESGHQEQVNCSSAGAAAPPPRGPPPTAHAASLHCACLRCCGAERGVRRERGEATATTRRRDLGQELEGAMYVKRRGIMIPMMLSEGGS